MDTCMVWDFIKEHYSDILASIAILLSLCQVGTSLYKNRVDLKVELENIDQEVVGTRKECIFVLSIVNKSTAPINISRVMFQDEKLWTSCRLKHAPVFIHNWPTFLETDIPRSERTFSSDFPVHIDSRGATGVIAMFRRKLSAKDFDEGDLVKMRIITDKKDIEFELPCKICSRERLAEYY